MRKFSTTAVLVAAIALLAFFAPYIFKNASEAGLKYLVTALQIAWFAGLIWSIRFGKRSLWLFTTAPFALFWPWGVLVVMTIGCSFESCD